SSSTRSTRRGSCKQRRVRSFMAGVGERGRHSWGTILVCAVEHAGLDIVARNARSHAHTVFLRFETRLAESLRLLLLPRALLERLGANAEMVVLHEVRRVRQALEGRDHEGVHGVRVRDGLVADAITEHARKG